MIPIVMIVPRNRCVQCLVVVPRIKLKTIINKSYPIDFSSLMELEMVPSKHVLGLSHLSPFSWIQISKISIAFDKVLQNHAIVSFLRALLSIV